MRTSLRPSILALAAILAVFPARARAQTDAERAGARSAGLAGLEAYSAGKYEQAVDYFTRAESLMHAPTHQLYLARANTKLGHLVSAREYYLKLTQERLPSSASKPFRDAQAAGDKELAELEPRVPYVTVVVQGGKNATDVQVTRDGEVIPPALLGVPHPEDPGTHTFKASATRMDSAPSTITLKEGAKETVVLTLNAVAGAADAEPAANAGKASAGFAADSEPEPSSSSRGPGLRIAAISGMALGAVGVGVGTFFLVKGASSQKDADALYDACIKADNCDLPDVNDGVTKADNKANGERTAGVVTTIIGGAFLVTGVTLLIVDLSASSSHAEARGPSIQPVLGLNFAGISGRF